MLSFNNLGNLGRLGNQMFQYASLKGIARSMGYMFCIPPKELFGVNDMNVRSSDCSIYDCFNFSNVRQEIIEQPILREKTFSFDKNLLINCPDNVDLLGYFQCEKYFESIEDEIRKDFTFKEDVIDVSNQIFEQLFSGTEVISLHIRRGDYLINTNHPVQTLEYYQNALNHFDENIPVIIFSDDHQWCDKQDIFQPDRFFISKGEDTAVDLCLMSMCNYHIIANSSYSWWGAWMAKSEKVIAPKNWFSGECVNKETKDIYCQNWKVL